MKVIQIMDKIKIMILSLKVEKVLIFFLILLCFFFYYKINNKERELSFQQSLFKDQLEIIVNKNKGLIELSEKLMEEIELVKDSINIIKNEKQKVRIKYVEKSKKIDNFNNNDIVNEFSIIFSSSNIRR